MKIIKFSFYIFFIISNVVIGKAQAVINKFDESMVTNNSKLKLTLIREGSKIVVNVSLSAKEGKDGHLKIFNSQKQLVSEFIVELKSLPEFFTINLDEYANDTYFFELTTNLGVHNAQLIIK